MNGTVPGAYIRTGVLLYLFFQMALGWVWTQSHRMILQPGDIAPSFRVPVVGAGYEEGAFVESEKLLGHRVVLVFYPKDSTPGCTQQACELRDGWTGIPEGTRVFGVSIDPAKSHRRFIEKFSLPYPLLVDEQKEIVSAYGIWVEKSLYGKKYMGTERSTFVIGPDGKIESILEKVKPAEHLGRLLDVLR